jgi:hypothetical protein
MIAFATTSEPDARIDEELERLRTHIAAELRRVGVHVTEARLDEMAAGILDEAVRVALAWVEGD